MAYHTYPTLAWNSRAISLAEHEQLHFSHGSGLLNYDGTKPVFADSSGRQVKLKAGVNALIRGQRFVVDSETIIDNTMIVANSSGQTRIDLVVLRLDRAASSPNAFRVIPAVITGTPAASPIAPSPVRNPAGTSGADFWDIPLAEVTVANGATSLADSTVKNRAWWVTSSGYTGFDDAKPPVEPGVQFRSQDAGITYIGTAGGKWLPIHYNSGWKPLNVPDGWNALTFDFGRTADLVVGNIRLQRTGGNYGATANFQFGILGDAFRPSKSVWAPYQCTIPEHSGHLLVQPDGLIVFAGTSQPVNTGANIIANPSWILG